jgi:hypothetical protein
MLRAGDMHCLRSTPNESCRSVRLDLRRSRTVASLLLGLCAQACSHVHAPCHNVWQVSMRRLGTQLTRQVRRAAFIVFARSCHMQLAERYLAMGCCICKAKLALPRHHYPTASSVLAHLSPPWIPIEASHLSTHTNRCCHGMGPPSRGPMTRN